MKVAQLCPTLCDPVGYTVHGILQVRILEWVAFPSPGDLPNPGIEPRFPALQAASLPAEPPGNPKNTGVGSLSLLQWIFPTQESNRGLLHCRRIPYQLSYQGAISKESAFNSGDVRDAAPSPGWEDPLEEEMATPSSNSRLENPMGEGTRPVTVHGLAKSRTRLSD